MLCSEFAHFFDGSSAHFILRWVLRALVRTISTLRPAWLPRGVQRERCGVLGYADGPFGPLLGGGPT
eukprot:198643-Pyramimonas_sp.AAC.1